MTPISLTVNDRAVRGQVEPRMHLADFLREHLHLTGTHLGCEQGVCGACTVMLDGKPQRSCIAYAVDCDGGSVTTIEGFDDDPVMAELRAAFIAHHGLQCGYCTPGMLVTARDIVMRLGEVPEARIREELSGNLCRCTGYVGIVHAIQAVCAGRQPVPAAAVAVQPVVAAIPSATPYAPPPPGVAVASALGTGAPVLTERLSLSAPPDAVWAALADLRAVAGCVPGAEVSALDGDHVTGRVRVSLGPITVSFAGEGTVTRDDATHSGRLTGRGRDGGSGTAVEGEARYALRPSGSGTELEISVSWRLTGALAQFSRAELVHAVARRVLAGFGANLEALIAGRAPVPARPLGLFALLWALIRAKLFGR
jgi:aerobic-type carbon monoxide dehydrogenase small subunit (CoxS/CutS family)/carbon monoxide dehydrogenase subunit G